VTVQEENGAWYALTTVSKPEWWMRNVWSSASCALTNKFGNPDRPTAGLRRASVPARLRTCMKSGTSILPGALGASDGWQRQGRRLCAGLADGGGTKPSARSEDSACRCHPLRSWVLIHVLRRRARTHDLRRGPLGASGLAITEVVRRSSLGGFDRLPAQPAPSSVTVEEKKRAGLSDPPEGGTPNESCLPSWIGRNRTAH